MSDHSHYGEYAEDRHDHDGDYAPGLHEHGYYDLSGVAEEHHRHYDEERELAGVRRDLDHVIADLRELREQLSAALGRIRDLEAQTLEARQAELEADIARADAAESGYGDESWRDTLADYQVASGSADYGDADDDSDREYDFMADPHYDAGAAWAAGDDHASWGES